MDPGIIGAIIGASMLVTVTGVAAIIKLQWTTLDRVTLHHEEFVAYRATSIERMASLEARVHEQDRVSLARALEQMVGMGERGRR